jgi:lipopolysaccharide transport system permease protein
MWTFLLPFLIVLMGVLGLGLGMIISSLVTKYRDFSHLIGFGVQLLMYVSAVVYPSTSTTKMPDMFGWFSTIRLFIL